MTNEERQQAIEWLKRRPVMIAGAKRMYDLAVEALEAYVPDTNVGDMISRQAATTIPVMPKEHRHYQTNNLDDAYEQGWNDLQECIKNLPPVQPNQNAEVSKMEIIHCKDCKFYGRADKRRFYRGSDCLNKRIDTIVPDRDFCSRAERGNAE